MSKELEKQVFESIRYRYHRSGRAGKGQILAEVQKLIKCHRKHAIRLMRKRQPGRKSLGSKRAYERYSMALRHSSF